MEHLRKSAPYDYKNRSALPAVATAVISQAAVILRKPPLQVLEKNTGGVTDY